MSATPSFSTIPDHSELEQMERRLQFHPSTTAAPAVLAPEQIASYNRDGYLKGLRVFDDEEISTIRTYFDGVLARVIAGGGDSYSISTAHLSYGRVWDILTEPRIVALVRDLLGPDVIGWGSHFFCKMPGDGKRVHWHQDASYWPLSETKTVTLWLAIDDADRENACMRYIPGSHLQGHLTYRLREDEPNSILNQEVENAEQWGEPLDVELKAGEASMHSDLLLHGSEENNSNRRRCGLTLRYCAAEVRAGLGWNAKGVVVSGSDPSGHWANPPRPADD